MKTNLVKSLLTESKLDWTISKQPLFWNNPKKVNTVIPIPYFGLIRSDTDQIMNVCSDQYEPRQNHEILDALLKIHEYSDFVVEKAGYVGSGQKVYFFIKNPQTLKIKSDNIERYLFALTSHDKTTNLCFGYSSKVLSCQNEFNRFYQNSEFQIKHTISGELKLNNIPEIIKEYLNYQDAVDNNFKKFASTPATKKLAADMVDYLMDTDKVKDELSTRKLNLIDELKMAIDHEVKTKGLNYWGLFNGITYYTNHVKKYSQKIYNSKVGGIFLGGGYSFSNKAYDYLLKNIN